MHTTARCFSICALTIVIAACAGEPPLADVAGSCADVYKTQLCTWATTKGGALVEVGATVPIATIENAPATDNMAWPPVASAALDLPSASQKESGFTQFTMYWEAGGHPPTPFMQPHFDFHFYLVSAAERMAIDCVDVTKPASLPAEYGLPDEKLPPEMAKMTGVPVLVGICIPQMGMHALPTDELSGKVPFRGDMVVGYFKGKPVFIEPMITKAMLMEKKSFDLAIPTIPGVGTHPSKFHAEFDAAKQSYRFAFSGFAAGS